MKKLLVPLGVILILAAVVWRFALSERLFTHRFPDGWTWEVNSIGLTGYPDPETGRFPEGTTLADDPINVSVRSVTAEGDGLPSGQVNITDHYQTLDPITSDVTWEFTTNAIVDAATGKHVGGEFAGDYYFLPRNVDRTATYTISNTSYRSLVMTFQREETISGIKTYLYGYYEPVDNTLSNSGVALESGEEIFCLDFSLEYWVEPITGEVVKFREWCEGDWVLDASTKEPLYAISRWGADSSGDDLIRTADRVRAELNRYQLMTLYIPLGLVLIGLALLATALLPKALQGSQKDIPA